MYIKRHITTTLCKRQNAFPAVLLTGPRQVGKSFLLKKEFGSIEYVPCDNSRIKSAIEADSLGYLEAKGTPLILDEVQKIPTLFSDVKVLIDENRRNGMYFLTGSQSFELMKNVSESLAGRVSIVHLLGLSNREIFDDDFSYPFLPCPEYFSNRRPAFSFNANSLWERIHKGSYPELYANENMEWDAFFDAYIDTYLERDIRDLTQVGNLITFRKFIVSVAARTGQLLNMADIAKDVGISQKTVKHWLSILEGSKLIFLLQPFFPNISKRIVKTPKVYFTDTGLISYLCRWTSPGTLMEGAMSGNVFESFVVSEILKSYYNAGKKPDMYYFRNTDGQEIDILIYENEKIHPLEIKKHTNVSSSDFKNFPTLHTYFPTMEIADGGVVCTGKELLPMGDKRWVIPVEMI